MALYEIEHNGKTYEVDAPDPQTAARAFAPQGDPVAAMVNGVPGSPEYMQAEAVRGAAREKQMPPATATQRAGALAGGVNQGVLSLLGLPMDTLANAANLSLAGMGYAQSKLTGKPPSAIFTPGNLADVPGSSAWNINQANKIPGAPASIPRPDDRASRYLAASGAAIPAALTARPTNAAAALRTIGATQAPAMAAQTAAEVAPDNPTAQIGAAMLTQMTPSLLRTGVRAMNAPPRSLTPAQVIVENARKEGLKFTPKEAGRPIGGAIEGLAGSAALERGISRSNQPKVNQLVRTDLGLRGDKPITAQDIAGLRTKANGAYDALASSGRIKADAQFAQDRGAIGGGRVSQMQADFPESVNAEIERMKQIYGKADFDAQSAIQASRALRNHASKNIRSDDPVKNDLGYAQKDMADAFDGMLERHAQALNKPKLAQDFKAARIQLAKIHSAEEAMNETTRDIEPPVFAKMLDKGAPLSGNMRLVGEAARAAAKSLQKTDRLPNEHVIGSAYEGIAGGSALTAAYALHNPWIAPLGFARPIARGVLRSDTMQSGGKAPPVPSEILRAYLLQLGQQSQGTPGGSNEVRGR